MITGRVYDATTNEPIWNASVFISDAAGRITASANGTTSNFDGLYSFTAPTGSYITCSHVSYKTKTLPLAGLTASVNFPLQPGATELPEVEIIDTPIKWWDKNKYPAIIGITIAMAVAAALYNNKNKRK